MAMKNNPQGISPNHPQNKRVLVQKKADLIFESNSLGGKDVKTQEQKNFDETLHNLLVAGLILSVVLMLVGLVLALITHKSIPTTVPSLDIVFSSVLTLEPSGLIALGLLILVATPIVRVISSIIVFIIIRDWHYMMITFIVLITVTISMLLGN